VNWSHLVVAFSVVWPFLAMASIPRRGQSSAPLAAMLVPVAVGSCGVWLGLDVSWMVVVLWPIAWIAILSLGLRHRTALDGYVLALSVILGIDLFAALGWLHVDVLAPLAAAASIVLAMLAALRLFFMTARQ